MYDKINEYLSEVIAENLDKSTDKFDIIEIDAKPEGEEFNSRGIEMTATFVVEIRRKDTKPKVSQIEDLIIETDKIEIEDLEIVQEYQGTRTYLFASTWNRQIKIKYKYTRSFK